MKAQWISGNRITLLENGEAFYPRVFESIANAQREVVLETFILFEDKVGLQLRDALRTAARRGARVDVMVDGFGSSELSTEFIQSLTDEGVRLRVFDPAVKLFGRRISIFRRMHRKIVVVDGERAFVGGINYSADHLGDYGPEAKQDYAIELEGPLVGQIHRFVRHAISSGGPGLRWFRRRRQMLPLPALAPTGPAEALFVTRDNNHHTTDIEQQYRKALREARHRVVIANAYFFPGYRLLREMRRAARRGVDVRLILQGEADMAWVKTFAGMLYQYLLRAGVRIYEYCERPLHGKVAVVDSDWSTVGSSNLDPLSLSLNLEANVVIRDREFNQTLTARLDHLLRHACKEVRLEAMERDWSPWRLVTGFLAYHAIRWYPMLATWFPRHRPHLAAALPERHGPGTHLRPDGATQTDAA